MRDLLTMQKSEYLPFLENLTQFKQAAIRVITFCEYFENYRPPIIYDISEMKDEDILDVFRRQTRLAVNEAAPIPGQRKQKKINYPDQRKDAPQVQCGICNKMVAARGMQNHMRLTHRIFKSPEGIQSDGK